MATKKSAKTVASKAPGTKRKYTKRVASPTPDGAAPTHVTYDFRNAKESHFFSRFVDKCFPTLGHKHLGDFTKPRVFITFPALGVGGVAMKAILDALHATTQDAFPNFLESKRSL